MRDFLTAWPGVAALVAVLCAVAFCTARQAVAQTLHEEALEWGPWLRASATLALAAVLPVVTPFIVALQVIGTLLWLATGPARIVRCLFRREVSPTLAG